MNTNNENTSNHNENGQSKVICSTDLLGEILWRLNDIREELMASGIGGKCYNCDEWSTPVINLTSAIKLIEKNINTTKEI
jgi:hypothetical protein